VTTFLNSQDTEVQGDGQLLVVL